MSKALLGIRDQGLGIRQSPRVGTGYDLHRLEPGRPLIIGGVQIPHEAGLAGHSDADVLCHAVTDAILGAAGEGDIGQHFPDTDPKWKGANSIEMLASAVEIVRAAGYAVANVDAVVIAERPKLLPHIPTMRVNLARAIGIDCRLVSVKGKTNEKIDALGRNEAIAVHAVALLAVSPKPQPMRVRFAPSPTGHLHVGNVRTALVQLAARARDTTARSSCASRTPTLERSTVESDATILDDLRWLGLDWDEGPVVGGPVGPYRSSERLGKYQARARVLLEEGHAYYCFCTAEQIEAERKEALARNLPPKYSRRCAHLDPADAKARVQAGEAAAIRFRTPDNREVVFSDLVRGRHSLPHRRHRGSGPAAIGRLSRLQLRGCRRRWVDGRDACGAWRRSHLEYAAAVADL